MKRFLVAALSAALLAGCGGGGGSAPASAPAVPPPGQKPAATERVALSIVVPAQAKSGSSARRAPRYVPHATAGAFVVVSQPSSGYSGQFATDISPGSPACNGATSTPRTCTITSASPSGSGVNVAITLYDQAPAGQSPAGKAIAAGSLGGVTVASGQVTSVTVTLGSIPASLTPAQAVYGVASDGGQHIVAPNVLVADADGAAVATADAFAPGYSIYAGNGGASNVSANPGSATAVSDPATGDFNPTYTIDTAHLTGFPTGISLPLQIVANGGVAASAAVGVEFLASDSASGTVSSGTPFPINVFEHNFTGMTYKAGTDDASIASVSPATWVDDGSPHAFSISTSSKVGSTHIHFTDGRGGDLSIPVSNTGISTTITIP